MAASANSLIGGMKTMPSVANPVPITAMANRTGVTSRIPTSPGSMTISIASGTRPAAVFEPVLARKSTAAKNISPPDRLQPRRQR
jgi:hypothetical protein